VHLPSIPKISSEAALDILGKWKDEKRRLHFRLFNQSDPQDFSCSGLGLIEEMTAYVLRIDNRNVKNIAAGELYGCLISLQRAHSFLLWDWRNVPPEEQAMKDALKNAYDLVLSIEFGSGARCDLCAAKSLIELGDLPDFIS